MVLFRELAPFGFTASLRLEIFEVGMSSVPVVDCLSCSDDRPDICKNLTLL